MRDIFTWREVTRQALNVLLTCVTREEGWSDGKMGVGRGLCEVMVGDGPLDQSRGLE